jgi:hypothetical protein
MKELVGADRCGNRQQEQRTNSEPTRAESQWVIVGEISQQFDG